MGLLPYALLAHPGDALVLGVGEGDGLRALARAGVRLDAVELADPPPDWAARFQRPGGESFTLPRPTKRPWLDAPARPGKAYRLALADLPRPLGEPPACDLITREGLAQLRSRLAPGGVAAVWLPFPAFEEDVLRAAATFAATFPDTAAWSPAGGGGILLIGSLEKLPITIERLLRAAPGADDDARARYAQTLLDQLQFWTDALAPRARGKALLTLDRSPLRFPLPRLLAGKQLVPDSDALSRRWGLAAPEEP